jgi:hypothetical protein
LCMFGPLLRSSLYPFRLLWFAGHRAMVHKLLYIECEKPAELLRRTYKSPYFITLHAPREIGTKQSIGSFCTEEKSEWAS